ncbi:MAG: thioredoxin family protein [Acidobacteria bacterium]|nr:thioredoxin family protein [Acidobacteriota bacterium]
MVLTPSNQRPLGSKAPDFALENPLTGDFVGLDDVRGTKGTLVMFVCNHCPFVKHVLDELVRIGHDFIKQGIGVVAINANDVVTYPQDGPKHMARLARDKGFAFPYLFDATQSVAKSYNAACTPDFFLFDGQDQLVYRGQMDGSRPGNDKPVDGADLRAAGAALIANQPPLTPQYPSIGCNIKWKM